MYIISHLSLALLKTTFSILLMCCLTGCISSNIIDAGSVFEHMAPKSVIVGKDGTIAVKATASYFRYEFKADPWYPWRSKRSARHQLPLNDIKQRDRYIILNPPYIKYMIKQNKTTQTLNGKMCFIGGVSLSYERFGHDWDDFSVVPDGFYAPIPSGKRLPASLDLNTAVKHSLNDLIPFKDGNDVVYLNFTHFTIDTDRGRVRWWTLPAAAPFDIVEEGCRLPLGVLQLGATVVGAVILIPCVILYETVGIFSKIGSSGRSKETPPSSPPKGKSDSSENAKKISMPANTIQHHLADISSDERI